MKGIKNSKYSVWIIAFVFALSIFAQSLLFHYLIYHEILFSTLWHSPEDFFRFYLPAATMAVFFGGLVFLFKNRWWTVAVSMLFNVWIWANLWYYRADSLLVEKYSISMINNLNGYWDSIFALIRSSDIIFLLLTLVLTVSIVVTKNKAQKSVKLLLTSIITTTILGITNGFLLTNKYEGDLSYMNPFKSYKSKEEVVFNRPYWYTRDHSIIHYLFYTIKDIVIPIESSYTFTQSDEAKVMKFFNNSAYNNTPKTKLLICIIESLNSFAIKNAFMPNTYSFINNNDNILYCDKIISQAKAGTSGDGQMIIQTGLLPINQGAACMSFPQNKYPSISSHYKTAGLFPHNLGIWNQRLMSIEYKIDTNFVLNDNDRELFQKTISLANEYDNVMMLTAGTHIPCTKYADSSDLQLPDTISNLLTNYIKCVNFADQGLKILFDSITQNERLKNFTIVITGDHCLPVPVDETFANAYNYSRFIPLIIYSPEIKQKTIITDTCYQMDIYPTILHLIGCEDYYWKGFGVNLLDSAARLNRPITPEEAYDLSDKMIRADYFKKL